MDSKKMKYSEKIDDSTTSRFTNLHDSIKPRKIPPQNIIRRLQHRQTYGGSSKPFYTNIFPNFTVSGVDKPPCFLRKFTPDGRHFIAFSSDLSSLEIYSFRGCQAGQHLLQDIAGDSITKTTTGPTNKTHADITSKIFSCFFTLLHSTKVTTQAVLNRECSLFTEDSRFVIVGSASNIPEGRYPSHKDMYHCNECLGPHANLTLEDFSIHLVEVATGILYDSINFKCDKIYLSHNQGIYLYKRTLAILSVQHQTIHIYQLSDDGRLLKCRSIGRFCFEDDQHLISMVTSLPLKSAYTTTNPPSTPQKKSTPTLTTTSQFSSPHQSSSTSHQPSTIHNNSPSIQQPSSNSNNLILPTNNTTTNPNPHTTTTRTEWGRNEKVMCSLKHKLLVFLYKKMSGKIMGGEMDGGNNGGNETGRGGMAGNNYNVKRGGRNNLSSFYRHWDFFANLKMWRMQMIDEDHLLIRYTTEEVVVMRSSDLNIQPSFFAVYNFKQAFFTCFYENTSTHLVSVFEDHSDLFRNSDHPHNPPFHHNRLRFKHNLSNAKQGSRADEIKRILGQLPICAQSYSSSPYLDYSYFCYDNKWVSALERPKTSGDHAIRFFSSESGLFKFKMFTGLVGVKSTPSPLSTRRLVAFIFHPYEPFAISVQRTNSDYVANFHVRNSFSNLPPSNPPPTLTNLSSNNVQNNPMTIYQSTLNLYKTPINSAQLQI